MLDLILKIGAVVAAAVAADAVTKELTGKHIHEHLFEWWRGMCDTIRAWLDENTELGIRQVWIVVLDAFDDVAVRTKQMADRVTLLAFGVDETEEFHPIVTEEVMTDEAVQQLPDLAETPAVLVQQF
jgi:hypothetical protein